MTKKLSDEELGKLAFETFYGKAFYALRWDRITPSERKSYIASGLAVKAAVLAEQKQRLSALAACAMSGQDPVVWTDADIDRLNAALRDCFPQASQTAVAVPEARFFFDHGLWHDRVTGQHMYTQDQYDELRRDALNAGWVIENGKQGDALRYRTWQDGVPVWTADPNEATRYSRRVDAENVHREDEDAWRIVEHVWHDLPTNSADESAPMPFGTHEAPGAPRPLSEVEQEVLRRTLMRSANRDLAKRSGEPT